MKRSSEWMRWLSTAGMGIAGGILMAGILLFFLHATGFSRRTFSFWLIAVLAAGIPWCFDGISRRGMNPIISEIIMIALSAWICLFYAQVISKTETTLTSLAGTALLVHLPCVLVTAVRWLIRYVQFRREEK